MVIGGNRWKSVFEVGSGNKSSVSVVDLDDILFLGASTSKQLIVQNKCVIQDKTINAT